MIAFDDILRMRQKELKHYLAGHLKKMGYNVVKQKGFLYAAGEVPVLLIAHLDTVHNEKPDIICRSEDGRYMMSPQGIGGDDRCGVYMTLQIINEARCHVLFPNAYGKQDDCSVIPVRQVAMHLFFLTLSCIIPQNFI